MRILYSASSTIAICVGGAPNRAATSVKNAGFSLPPGVVSDEATNAKYPSIPAVCSAMCASGSGVAVATHIGIPAARSRFRYAGMPGFAAARVR